MSEDSKPLGRPTKFDPEYVEQAYKLALLGATDEDMADFWGVSVPTLHAWRKAHPEFLKSTRAGKMAADAEIAESLHHRAKGYSHPAVKIMSVNGEVRQVDYTEHYPPDTAAASLWLRNRQPALWRDKIETQTDHRLVDENNKPMPLDVARRVAFLFAQAGEGNGAPAPTPTKH